MKVTGQKIRQFREAKGLTSAELAAKINPPVSRQALEAWERNGVGSFKTLTKIAQALDMPEAIFLD